jgi:hypothetical protein
MSKHMIGPVDVTAIDAQLKKIGACPRCVCELKVKVRYIVLNFYIFA